MTVRILTGDCREVLATLPDESVHCCVTSPPYWGLRDYGVDGALGLEATPEEYLANMVEVFREVRRVMRDDGTLWLNMGDSYAQGGRKYTQDERQVANKRAAKKVQSGQYAPGSNFANYINRTERAANTAVNGLKAKDLCGIPWRLALALQMPWLQCHGCGAINHRSAWGHFPNGRLICPNCEKSKGWDVETPGWWLRSDIIWAKPNPMPESVTDRPTKAHEYLFLLTKRARYFYDADAVREESLGTSGWEKQRQNGTAKPRGEQKTTGHLLGNRTDATVYEVMQSHPLGRNRRTVWTIATQPFPEAHFATFPPALVEPCIKAGTSERGVCPECGAGWVRVVEVSYNTKGTAGRYYKNKGKHSAYVATNNQVLNRETITTGWRPGCTCDAGDPIPAICLDPFGGAGTVGLVADRLGRDALLIELNENYAHMARRRIVNDAGMFADVEVT